MISKGLGRIQGLTDKIKIHITIDSKNNKINQ